jgi:DNA-binding transcriptional MerR regulator
VRNETDREWPITDVAAMTGTTSRALRHYGELGILRPSRIGDNGYRYYDREGLVRLQRILLLRQLGLGLPTIGQVLDNETDVAGALETHIERLRDEQRRLDRQLESVRRTLDAIRTGKDLDMAEMFDGFDHTQYKDEVEQRWGTEAYARSAKWWESKTPAERARWQAEQTSRSRAWTELAKTDASPDAPDAQALAAEHVRWLQSVPGTPAASGDPAVLRQYVLGLAEMYVADERFAANYGGAEGAAFVKAALEHYIATV